jgi:hypothetical protein
MFAFGTMPYAGRWVTGETAVTFNPAEGGSYASTWPEWIRGLIRHRRDPAVGKFVARP